MEWSVVALAERLKTEADAYLFLEELRWDGTPVCPHCGSEKAYFLNPANGVSRKTRTGATSQRRVWKCAECRKQFSVLTGTIFHSSKIPVRTWLFVIFEMCANKNGVAAREVERKYNLTAKSAWHMLHRIREAMKREPLAGMLSGEVMADEAFIGGASGNRSKARRAADREPRRIAPGQRIQDKTVVLSLISKTTGEVRSQVIPDVTGATLRKTLAEQTDMAATTLVTDEWAGYLPLRSELAGHRTVNHERDQYVVYADGQSWTTNHVEGYFSQLKRSLDGTHHHVSAEHLGRYLAEFDYRYSTRKLSDTDRSKRLVKQIGGKRLTYRPLVGR